LVSNYAELVELGEIYKALTVGSW